MLRYVKKLKSHNINKLQLYIKYYYPRKRSDNINNIKLLKPFKYLRLSENLPKLD